MRQRVSSGSPFEERIGFSRAVRADRHVYVAGTAPVWPEGDVPEEVGLQAQRCLQIIEDALREVGAELEDVVRTRVYLVDRSDADEVAEVHGAVFGDIRPASTMVLVGGLLDPRWRVEIEAQALVDA